MRSLPSYPLWDRYVVQKLDAADLELLNSCLAVEHEFRARGFEAVEQLPGRERGQGLRRAP